MVLGNGAFRKWWHHHPNLHMPIAVSEHVASIRLKQQQWTTGLSLASTTVRPLFVLLGLIRRWHLNLVVLCVCGSLYLNRLSLLCMLSIFFLRYWKKSLTLILLPPTGSACLFEHLELYFLNFGSLNALFHYILMVLCTTIMVAWQLHWNKSQVSPVLIIKNHTNLTQMRKRSATIMLEGEQQTSTPILAVQYFCNLTFFSENYKYPQTISREKKETKEWSRRATNKKVKNSEGYRFSVGCRRQETEKQRGTKFLVQVTFQYRLWQYDSFCGLQRNLCGLHLFVKDLLVLAVPLLLLFVLALPLGLVPVQLVLRLGV